MPGPVTIDTITFDPSADEYVLYLVEDGPWPVAEEGWRDHLRAVQDRILSAVDVAVDGHLAAKYPESSGKGVRIQVDSPSGCPARVQDLVSALDVLLTKDADYSSAVRASEYVRSLRIVTGKQMGRFGDPEAP